MESTAVAAAGLPHMRDEQRTKCAGEAPSSQHEAVNRPDVFGSEVVGGEGRHGAEPTAVTHQHNEADESERRNRGDLGKNPEEQDLQQKHHNKSGSAPPRVDCTQRNLQQHPSDSDTPTVRSHKHCFKICLGAGGFHPIGGDVQRPAENLWLRPDREDRL